MRIYVSVNGVRNDEEKELNHRAHREHRGTQRSIGEGAREYLTPQPPLQCLARG